MKKIDISRLSDDHIMRRLSPADWAQVLDIMEDNPLYYEHSGKQPTRGQIFQDMAALPDGKTAADKYYLGYFERQYLVAVLDLIDGWPDADTAYIGFFMVDGCMQGEGLGTALMEQLCLYCGELGYRRVMLGWDKGNPQSEHFWRKLGFEPAKESGRYIVVERLLPAPKEEGKFESCLLAEAAQHPLMKARDALKMCYQAARGAEHGIKDANAARKYLRDEIKAVEADGDALFYAPISPELCRVDLRAWKARGLKWQWLYNMFEKCRGDGLMDEKLAAVEHPDGTIIPKIKISENIAKITLPGVKIPWRLYDNETGKALADVICMNYEKIDDTKPYEIFDPVHTWKRKTITNFTAKKLQIKIVENGKQVYTSPSVKEISKYRKQCVDNLWDEVKRFENPHTYYVDLSQELWDLREKLLKEKQ